MSSRQAAWILSLLATAYSLAVIDRSLLSYMTESLKLSTGLTDLQLGTLQGAAFAIPYALVAVPSGWLADQIPRRILIAAGLALWSLATITFGLFRTFEAMLVSRILLGVGEAMLHPSAFSLLADLYRAEQRPAAMSVYSLGPVLGAIGAASVVGSSAAWGAQLAHLLGGAAMWSNWGLAFILAGVPGVLLAAAIACTREPTRGSSDHSSAISPTPFLEFLRQNFLTYLALISGLATTTLFAYGVNSWIPAFLQRAFHWSLVRVSSWSAIEAVAVGFAGLAIGASLPGWLINRGTLDAVPRVAAIAILAAAFPGVLAFTANSGELAFVFIAFMDMLLAITFALAPVAIQAITPPQFRGRISGLYLFVNTVVGMTLGPLWVAFVAGLGITGAPDLRVGLIATVVIAGPASCGLLWSVLQRFRHSIV